MNVYDPQKTLDAISDNAVAVVAIGGVSILAMFGFFAYAALAGRRDRAYPEALWMTALWWPHDGSYLLHADDWFGGGPYDHWFMQLFWVAIIVTFVAESTFFVQAIIYGRDELSPGYGQAAHTARMVGALAAGVVSWALLKGVMDDPLYLMSFMGTLLWGGPSMSTLVARRRDGRGLSLRSAQGFAVMTVCYSITSIGFFGGGFFHSWQYVGICVAATLWSLVLLRDVARATAWRPRPALRVLSA